MSSLKDAISIFQTLKKEFSKKNPNLEKCDQHMQKLKVALTDFSFLSYAYRSSVQEYVLARDALEIGAQLSIMKKDIPAFERYISQLKCYYLDFAGHSQESPYKHQLLGLNLLCLLAQNRVAEFHTELERLSTSNMLNSVYLKHPIAMEQYLMEGNYNKLFLARGNVPAESYNFFIDILLNTIRDEIATCMEKSYSEISHKEALRMLYFEKPSDLKQYAEKRKWDSKKGDSFHFDAGSKHDDTSPLPSTDLASQVINYARELEMII